MSSKGEWVVGDTIDTNGLNNEDYKSKYQQQLQVGRRRWLEENRRPRKGDTADTEQTIQTILKTVQEKEAKLKEKENEKVRDAQRFCKQLEQKEREEVAKEQEMQRYCQEKEKEEVEKEQQYHRQLQEKERELRQSQDAVRIYQQIADNHWVIDKDEVILTREELGRGSYATVNVGIFRGLRVAVKSLNDIIISDFNLALFSREMSIVSRVSHPNLVQFIGATKVDNPLILTELMSTSLYKEIRKIHLTKQQILSIAQDVALGLNYLHLFKPQPIIHRDVSSPNVLPVMKKFKKCKKVGTEKK